ncbi:MAG: class I SAM-dependent methyltransferase [candidate division Zixibacteria bacterium]|nr:class I SAM-dependent methyltransferase [candidate division Zixibacteria bacterium]
MFGGGTAAVFTVFDKTWNEYWANRWLVDHRHQIHGIFDYDRALADVIASSCRLHPGMRVYNPACGAGDQARALARKGFMVTARDSAEPLIAYAKKRSDNEGLKIDFAVGDIRENGFREQFNAVLLLDGAFGEFGPDEDTRLLENLCKMVRPGGSIFVMFRTEDRLFGESKVWFEQDDGWLMCEEHYDEAERVSYLDFVLVCDEGAMIRMRRPAEQPADIVRHCYAFDELKDILVGAGCEQCTPLYAKQLIPHSGPLAENPIADIIVAQRP